MRGGKRASRTKVDAPTDVFDLNTELDLMPTDGISKNLAKTEDQAGIHGNGLQGLPKQSIIDVHKKYVTSD